MTIYEMKRRLMGFDISQEINECVKKNEKKIIDYNTNDQLYNKGINERGEKLKPYPYSKGYLKVKKRYGERTDHITLKLIGRFYKNFIINYKAQEFSIFSNPVELGRGFSLRDHLKKRYGDIFGLTEDSKQKLREILKYDLQERLRKAIA